MYPFSGIMSLPEIPPNLPKKAYGMFIVLKTSKKKTMKGTLCLWLLYQRFTQALFYR